MVFWVRPKTAGRVKTDQESRLYFFDCTGIHYNVIFGYDYSYR
jgi:hypothetical protein